GGPARAGARRAGRGRGAGQAPHEARQPRDRRARRLDRVGGGLPLRAGLHRSGHACEAHPGTRMDTGAEGDRDRGRGPARGGAPARDRPPRRQALPRPPLAPEARSLQGPAAQAPAPGQVGRPPERSSGRPAGRSSQRALPLPGTPAASAATPWRVLFMGTPRFAGTILEALLARPDPVVGVVCQPDRPRGRGLAVEPPAVKVLATERGLPILQPERVRDPAFLDALRALAPGLVVVAAYGRILPRTILDLPPRGCINVHASLLPRHRGAAPVTWAILAGDRVTGVTIMAMSEEMDAGDILLQREVPITPADNGGTLTERLS